MPNASNRTGLFRVLDRLKWASAAGFCVGLLVSGLLVSRGYYSTAVAAALAVCFPAVIVAIVSSLALFMEPWLLEWMKNSSARSAMVALALFALGVLLMIPCVLQVLAIFR